jgi:lipid II:glycine glycyltransferase (peptidoglycan interpeptide bridge formation enzyme)
MEQRKMSMRVERLDASGAAAWDAFVRAHPCGHFMQSWAWGAFRAGLGWEPIRLMAFREDRPCGAMQVLRKRLPGGFAVLCAPRGPVADPADGEVLAALFAAARRLPGLAASLRLDPYWTEDAPSALSAAGALLLPETWSYWNAPKYVFWLDLDPGLEVLSKRLASSQRSEIRYPAKHGVTFTRGDASDVGAFHALMAETARHKGIACHGQDYYRGLLEGFGALGMADLVFAEFEGKKIATGLTVRYGDKAWLMYAASDKDHYHLRANRALQWEMIRAAAEAGCRRYDFRGTATGNPPDPKDPGYGVYEFKKSFGPEFVSLVGYCDVVFQPLLHRIFRFAETRGLPMAYDLYKKFRTRPGQATGKP